MALPAETERNNQLERIADALEVIAKFANREMNPPLNIALGTIRNKEITEA